ncbi:MAG: 1,2-diacylglycerol 3-alpha-glucosyltransferase [Cellvibrionaceae bacterium]|jgi:1,2-diacylglycerol 3-alpha-glucosyltransferase
MLKIAMVTSCYHPVINGVVRMIELYREHLTALGHSVTVFTFGRPSPQDGTYTVRIPAVPLGRSGYYFTPRFPNKIMAQLNQMDIVHCHHLFMGPERLANKINVPIVYTNHTRYDLYTEAYLPLPSLIMRKNLRKKVAQRLINHLWPSNTAGCSAVIAPSENVAGVMRSFGVTAPIHVIHNGIVLADFQKIQSHRTARPVTGVYVGRLAAEKNVPLLLDSLIEICLQNNQLRFRLIGHGPLHNACQQKITKYNLSHQIFLEGWVPKEEIPQFLAQSDFQITMSISEVHPLGIIEGMAAGLPAVVLANDAMAECVGGGALMAGSPAAWIEAVEQLAGSADLRHSLGSRAKQQAAKYDIGQTVSQTLTLYRALL